jgi:hypothetical protein
MLLLGCVVASVLGCARDGGPIDRRQLETELRVVALKYMFAESSRDDRGRYSAYVIDEDLPESAFAGHVPRVSNTIEAELRGQMVNKADGKPVVCWSSTVWEVTGRSATVAVSAYVAPLGAAGYRLKLRRSLVGWVVVSEEMTWVS